MSTVLGHFPTLMVEGKNDRLEILMASEKEPREVLRGFLGQTIVPSGSVNKKKKDDSLILNWPDGTLRITHTPFKGRRHRYDFYWTSTKPTRLLDTFDMSGGYWYGGAHVRKMLWPLNKWNFKVAPFVAEDCYKDGEFGGVQERYWLSSNGVGIFIHQAVPLFVGINEGNSNLLHFETKFESPYRNNTHAPLTLRYSIYHAPDIMGAHRLVMENSIEKPLDIPDTTMFRLPVWSTWAICKADVDQVKVLSLANQIKSYKIDTAQLEIDDDWSVHRGDWDFDRRKFPNPREMTRRLQEFGFHVTVWVHPFSNLKSKSIKKSELFVKGQAKGATRWWNGIGRILDVTSPAALEWYKKELSLLKENYNLKSFKFDAGETNWLPKKWRLYRECNNPNIYTQKWAELAYELDKDWRAQEVRVGVRSQKLPIFVRMMDKDSVWDEKNGLRSIIPTALLYGLIGYPFVLPDMIGGNAYEERPTKQLFIRWMQLCTFMPGIQFSIPPWWFDAATVKLTKSMLALRAKYAHLLIELAKEATKTGAPIIRPLWWIAPTDDFALKCDDEFLVGDDLLVAPVVVENAKKRPIYLPAGKWRDERSGKILEGRSWYFEYQVTLSDLPHFTKVKEEDAAKTETVKAAENVVLAPVATDLVTTDDTTDSQKPSEPDLIKWDDDNEALQSPTTEPSDQTSLLDLEPSQGFQDRKSILQPQQSVDTILSAAAEVPSVIPEEPEREDIKEFDTLRAEARDIGVDTSSDSELDEYGSEHETTDDSSKAQPTDTAEAPAVEMREKKNRGSAAFRRASQMLSLLRRSTTAMTQATAQAQPGEEELSESTFVSGKYRDSTLLDDFGAFDLTAELSDGSSLVNFDVGQGQAPLARIDTYKEPSSDEQESDDDDTSLQDIGDSEEDRGETLPSINVPDLSVEVSTEGTTVGGELDSTVPASGDSVKEKSLYENVYVPAGSGSDDTSSSSQPAVQRRQLLTPKSPDGESKRLTLWDELTDKLKDMPKFDPDEDAPDADDNQRTFGVQTSFDFVEKSSKKEESDSSDSS